MISTTNLIKSLSKEAKPAKTLPSPHYWGARLFGVLAVYAILAQVFLGLRADIAMQLSRPLFALEIILLATLALASFMAAILVMYPDAYQKPKLLKLPYGIFIALFVLMSFQLLVPADVRMIILEPSSHSIECALCIGATSIIPSAIIFIILRKGASVRIFQAGSFAVLAAGAIGGLTLRLAEANDSIEHLLTWHYVPTLIFASIGALLGKFLLKW